MIRTDKLAFALLIMGSMATADVLKDFDSLGGNDVLLERAQRLNPETDIEIVQDRTVDRRMRSELQMDLGAHVGGDAYVATQSLGLGYNLHLTPRWSVGARGSYYFNRLRDEGRYLIDRALDAEANASEATKQELKSLGLIPDIDWPLYSYYGVLNFYPIYGKMNILNMGVAQYDVYLLGGAGQVELRKGPSSAFMAGGGIGIWISQHLSSRFEARWETWEAKRYSGKERMNMTALGVSMGYLL